MNTEHVIGIYITAIMVVVFFGGLVIINLRSKKGR